MPDKPQTGPDLPVPPRSPGGGRRRGHRGGRGRGPRRTGSVSPTSQPADVPAAAPPQKIETSTSAISQAIDEVTQVVESLKQTLDQMEEVLELVEVAERQKLADEREIESLRQALRRVQQPRGERPERPPPND